MTTTNSNEVIDKLPEIGDFIKVRDDKLGDRIATVISMAECKKLAPELWTDAFGRLRDDDESDTYGPGDVIRAYKFENGDAEFCIMRFSDTSRQGVSFNKHIFKLEAQEIIKILTAENHRLKVDVYMCHLGCLPVLQRCRKQVDSELRDQIDYALGDAAELHKATMDIHQMKSGEWWIEPRRF